MKSEERKNTIIMCAKKIFSEKGYYEMQIIDIVNELHISKGNPYQYFRNKEDLFLQVIEHIHQQWQNFQIDNYRFKSDPSHEDYLRYMITKIIMFFDYDHESATILLRMGPGINRSIEPFFEKLEYNFLKYIRTSIEKAVQKKVLSADLDIEFISNTILGILTRISYYYLIIKKERNEKVNIDELINKIVDQLLKILQ